MTEAPRPDRRRFLSRLARAAVYSAPVVHTLAAPRSVQGQGLSGKGKGMGGSEMVDVLTPVAPGLPTAPWARHPGDEE